MLVRVVIAEDHDLVREGIRHVVQASGDAVVVGEAADGAEAVQLVSRMKPDVVLMDISLPRLSGIEATRKITAGRSSTAVLMLTAYEDEAYVSASIQAGAAGYLLKTTCGEELASAIRKAQAGCRVFPAPCGHRRPAALAPLPITQATTQIAHPLTDREWEVLRLAAHGLTNKSIALQLGLSTRTVENHLANLYPKLRVSNRTEAVFTCLERGWLPLKRPA
jgi:two-component system, NarL family, response regulator LiaR